MDGDRQRRRRTVRQSLIVCALLVLAVALSPWASGNPSGATVLYVRNTTAGSAGADNRSDLGGTITTLILNATQQNENWKAYVGNVTGVLTLDNTNGDTIYDWQFTGVNITGEVYVTRDNSVNFDSVSCANSTIITAEETFLNMTSGAPDSINGTFSSTTHQSFSVGTTSITNSTCQSTFTYVNDTAPGSPTESTPFQEVLLQDNNSIMLYVTLIENDETGYDLNNYDFQLLVGENGKVANSRTTYYFYTEIAT